LIDLDIKLTSDPTLKDRLKTFVHESKAQKQPWGSKFFVQLHLSIKYTIKWNRAIHSRISLLIRRDSRCEFLTKPITKANFTLPKKTTLLIIEIWNIKRLDYQR
jgi:hypothetical protein